MTLKKVSAVILAGSAIASVLYDFSNRKPALSELYPPTLPNHLYIAKGIVHYERGIKENRVSELEKAARHFHTGVQKNCPADPSCAIMKDYLERVEEALDQKNLFGITLRE
jgi:hypothetical protein